MEGASDEQTHWRHIDIEERVRIGWRMQELATFVEPELMLTESSWQGPGEKGGGCRVPSLSTFC